ncbi:protein maelstrom 1-like [Glossina fuscipes]|uniref:Protein maelstrom 1-like n=1 Tax=Glossina fuscipes TaxID=7396 RepID=A0A8U0W7J9_9MUSC|nr:protein maelstrom 1-like [Glossina fuscipes]KAI9588850.1 hypothetical protein GQX74_007019 [Glossina fuscipes]
MAPKKQCTNGFMVFTFEWKAKYGKQISLRDATAEAGKIWANMNMEERSPYNEKAKEEKVKMRKGGDKLTCVGTSISQMDRQKLELEQKEKQIKRIIEQTVRNSEKDGELEHKAYYFITVNYFTKILKGNVYIPAELSVCEYSLKQGVSRIFHTLINPGTNVYGHQYEAQYHSETTHNLPLPPKALGDENLGTIYNEVLRFLGDTDEYPPLYTARENIHIVVSVLDFLKSDIRASNKTLNIYPIQYLFYVMKESTCEQGELEKPKSFHITDAYFERDYFEYQSGIACQFHEDKDKSKYCTQSIITRWGYMFSDYMCRDIAIPLILGRHVPQNTNLEAIITPARANCSETNSLVSLATSSNYSYKVVADSKLCYDDNETTVSSSNDTKTSYKNDFPALGSRKKIPTPAGQRSRSSSSRRDYEEEYYAVLSEDVTPELNPWATRSLRPESPQLADSCFIVNSNRSRDQDNDADRPIYIFGRGRQLPNINEFNANTTARGPGRLP